MRLLCKLRSRWIFTGLTWSLWLGLSGVACHEVPKRDSDVAHDLPATESMVIKAGHIEQDLPESMRKLDPKLEEAETAFQQADYRRAAKLFGKVADNTRNPPLVAEKARFFEAESQRMLNRYPDAMATYNRLLQDFSFGVYREQSVARMFEIAKFWLEDTWVQLGYEQEKAEGKRWFVPSNYLHWDERKPTFDEEGHALKMLEQVYYNDPTGEHATEALYLIGFVHFSRGNFREADQFLSQMLEMEAKELKSPYRKRNAQLYERGLELAILAKSNSTGGPLYDGRKHAEALKLIHNAPAISPEFAQQKSDFLTRQMEMVRYQQAEKDYQLGEYYRRTGRPASAWFYYELVRRRYAGTPFHDQAVARMRDIQKEVQEYQREGFDVALRRGWNEYVLGHETPRVASGQTVPQIPGEKSSVEALEQNPIVPTGGIDPRTLPGEGIPR